MSPEALVMEILGEDEMPAWEIAERFPWWLRWAARGALRRLVRNGMVNVRGEPWSIYALYRAKDISLAPLRGGDVEVR